MTPRPPMPGETPLSASEAAYLHHDHALPEAHSISIEVCRNNDSNWQARPNLRQLANAHMGKGIAGACEFTGFGYGRAGTQEAGVTA